MTCRPSPPLPLRLREHQMLPEAAAAAAPASPGAQLITLIYVSGLGLGSTTQAPEEGLGVPILQSCSDMSSARPSPTDWVAQMGADASA